MKENKFDVVVRTATEERNGKQTSKKITLQVQRRDYSGPLVYTLGSDAILLKDPTRDDRPRTSVGLATIRALIKEIESRTKCD